MSIINQSPPTGLSQAQLQQRRDAGKARAKQFTAEYQRKAVLARNAQYGRAALSGWGKLGWLALISKVGYKRAIEICRQGGERSFRVQQATAIEAGHFPNQSKAMWGICEWPGCHIALTNRASQMRYCLEHQFYQVIKGDNVLKANPNQTQPTGGEPEIPF